MSTLHVWKNYTPNRDTGVHWIFNNPAAQITYINSITPSVKVFTNPVTVDNYRIDNTGKLLISTTDDGLNVNQLTYCAEVNGNCTRFYHITGSKLINGYIESEIELDNWATYINNAKFDDMHMVRCNRTNASYRGIYDPVNVLQNTSDRPAYDIITPTGVAENQMGILFSVVESVKAVNHDDALSWIANQDTSYPKMYWVYLGTNLETGDTLQQNFFKLQEQVSNIFQHVIGGGAQDPAVKVTNAWFIPLQLIKNISGSANQTFRTFKRDRTEITLACREVYPGEFAGHFDIAPTQTHGYNYKYVLGSRFNGMSVRNFTDAHYYANINVSITYDGLRAVISYADESVDVSSDLAIGLIQGEEGKTGMNMFTNAFQHIANGISNSVFGIVKGVLDTVNDYTSIDKGSYRSGGNGYLNAYVDNVFKGVFYLTYYASTRSEESHANHQGINYDMYIADISTLKTWTKPFSFTYLYLKCDHLEVDNIPASAAEDIRQKLLTGIMINDNRT